MACMPKRIPVVPWGLGPHLFPSFRTKQEFYCPRISVPWLEIAVLMLNSCVITRVAWNWQNELCHTVRL